MNCMKCGRETQDGNVFCMDCLLEMEKHPICPGTVVLLPRRREHSIIKKPVKRHVPSSEEKIKYLRKWILILTLSLIVCIVAIALMFKPTMHYVLDEHVEIGQNYSSITPAVPSTATGSAE